jgi:arylsulfatase A-like enzyme
MRYPMLLLLTLVATATIAQKDNRPNLLLIVADDLGYSDLGCYGGDIRTPVIDRLAREGQLFTQFHTAPTCAPTRAMLLSGNNNHVAGMGRQGGAAKGSWEAGQPGYEGYLSDRVVPFPQLLRDAGYHTYTAGKWHLGKQPENSPAQKGFERSFNLLQGASNHYNSVGLTLDDSLSQYSADGKLVRYPEGRYSTEFYTDKLLEFIKQGRDGKPFFVYAAYTSPHWPLQAPAANDRYKGKYDMGYDSLRALRLASLKKAGIVDPSVRLVPRLNSVKAWNTLSTEEKAIESRKMELYAAMVDNLDEQIGRLLQFLRDEKLYENTIIVFMSDNGAAGEDFYVRRPYSDFIRPRYDNRYENMGSATSFVCYGTPWALAGAAPFSYHKGYATEGGIVAPLIVSGKGINAMSTARREFVTVMDLAPTFLEWAKAPYPGKRGGTNTQPMLGESLGSYIKGKSQQAHSGTYGVGLEQGGTAYYRKGKWKLTTVTRPYREEDMKLYDVETDPGESVDLSTKYPEKRDELLNAWRVYQQAHGIRIAQPPK